MARAFNGGVVPDVTPFVRRSMGFTFAGFLISAIGGVLFLVSILRRRRRIIPN